MRVSFAVVVLAVTGCSSTPLAPDCQLVEDEAWGPRGEVDFEVETVASGLEVPWGVAFLPDGGMLVTERGGRLVLLRNGQRSTVAEVPVHPAGEGGLLGIALDPDFESSRAIFLYYTAQIGDGAVNRVERWLLSGDASTASADGIIVDGIPAGRFHNGGRLRIGPDDKLYIGTGDARQPELSQDVDSLAGKILRVDLDGSIPDDNPFDSPTWIYGIRNTQGFDWIDEQTMVVTDHGPSGELGRADHDEVNVARSGDNLGWPTIYACQAQEGMRSPSMTWARALPPGGAAIYRGDAIDEWKDSLLVGALGAEHLHRVVLEAGRVTGHETYLLGTPPAGEGRLRDVIMGPDGDLYLTTSNCDGRGPCPDDGDRILRLTR